MEYKFRSLQQWPRKETPSYHRGSPFKSSLSKTYRELDRELRHLKARDPIMIQIALNESDIRLDGLPRADARRPRHPGVVLTFNAPVGGRTVPLNFMCDDCHEWEDNLRAIVLTLERLRLADLYGVTKSGEQYRGWAALPPAAPIITPPAMTVEEAARFVANAVGMGPSYSRVVSESAQFREWYREAALKLHPDPNGGGPASADWHSLQAAKSVLDRHHGL